MSESRMALSDYQYIGEAPIGIEPQEVLRYQGCRVPLAQVKEDIQSLVRSQISHSHRFIKPQAVYRFWPARLYPEGKVKIEGGSELSIGRGARKWTGLQYIALAICTVGTALEKEISRLFSVGEYAAAVMLDSVGTVAVESLADHVNDIICQQVLAEGLSLTHRISPGYGDWALEEQKTVFALLPGDRIDVTLTGTCMMQPRKSVSFITGIGEGFGIKRSGGRCRQCDMVDCPYRAG